MRIQTTNLLDTAPMRPLRIRSSTAGLNPPDGYMPSHAAKGGPSLRAAGKLLVIRRRRRSSPKQVVTASLALAAMLVIGTAYAVHLHSDAELSAFVQSQGLPVTGTVLSIQNSGYHSRAWHHYTAKIEIRLSAPVAGDQTSTVYYPDTANMTYGQSVRVLVDPRNPGYAEFPGYPYYSNSEWIFVAAVVGFVPGFLLLCALVSIIAMIRRRRGLTSL
jgi:Protein of unknown function (DUF3592)